MNLETGEFIHLGKGKGKKALQGFWGRPKHSKAKIETVSTDMASGYIFEVSDKLPDALLVLDHFHIVKWFNDKLTQLRRDLYREAKGICKDVLKVVRWLLLKKPQDLKTHRSGKKIRKRGCD